jgi:hypothetical protein
VPSSCVAKSDELISRNSVSLLVHDAGDWFRAYLIVSLALSSVGARPEASGEDELVVASVRIKKTKTNGKAWDAAYGRPNPYMIAALLAANGKDSVSGGKMMVNKDTSEPRWQSSVLSVSVGDVVELGVGDKDVASDYLIGKDQLSITKEIIEQCLVRLSESQRTKLAPSSWGREKSASS